MSIGNVYVIVPTEIDDSKLTSTSVSEPDTGETAWVSAGTYALGDVRIRTSTHRKYEALIEHTGRTTAPESDPTYWLDIGPTNAWACFDDAVSTATTDASPITLVLQPGNFDAIAFYGVQAESIEITVKDEPAGSVIFNQTYDMQVPPLDWWDWFFGEVRQLTKLAVTGIEPYPDAELTIEITGASSVSVGMITIGDNRSLIGDSDWGGPLHGASAEPRSFSQITTDLDGTTSIVRRRSATDMRLQVVVPRDAADYCLATIQDVLDLPCAWIGSTASGYEGLNSFGLGSGALVYENATHAVLSLNVKGLV